MHRWLLPLLALTLAAGCAAPDEATAPDACANETSPVDETRSNASCPADDPATGSARETIEDAEPAPYG